MALVAAVIAVVGCGGSGPEHDAKTPKGNEAQSAMRARAGASYLTLDSIPQSAREALAAQAPDFVPWSADSYARADRDSTRMSSDGGLSIVRGRFRAPNAVDYIIAGYDRRQHDLRIVAVLAEPSDTYKVMIVSEGPAVSDSLAAKPHRYLAVDSTGDGQFDMLVLPLGGGAPVNTTHYTWVPARRQFLIVTPN